MGHMSTGKMWQTSSTSSGATEKLGELLGYNLRGGEVIELISDLGGGKTTFVRGLARGFGSKDKTASPSFTIGKVYKAGSKEMHHFDFYRLSEAGVVEDELAEILGDQHIVTVVEWANIIRGVLPKDRLSISFRTIGEDTRQITFKLPSSLDYLMKGLV